MLTRHNVLIAKTTEKWNQTFPQDFSHQHRLFPKLGQFAAASRGCDKAPLPITTKSTGCSPQWLQLGIRSWASKQLLPHLLASLSYLFCHFPPFDISQRGLSFFFMGMTGKPVVRNQTRVKKFQAKIKSNRWWCSEIWKGIQHKKDERKNNRFLLKRQRNFQKAGIKSWAMVVSLHAHFQNPFK